MSKVISYIPFPKITLSLLAINLTLAILVLFLKSLLPPQIPLFFGLPRGENQLSTPSLLTIPLIIATLLSLVNTLFLKIIHVDFFQKILIGTNITITILAIISVFKIISLVGHL